MTPLWIDKQYSTTGDSFVFRLKEYRGGQPTGKAYEGVAYPYPDGNIVIDISEIVRDMMSIIANGGANAYNPILNSNYLDRNVNTLQGFWVYTYQLVRVSGETETLLETYEFAPIWDNEIGEFSSSQVLSNPVNGKMDPRMFVFYTVYKPDSGTIIVETK